MRVAPPHNCVSDGRHQRHPGHLAQRVVRPGAAREAAVDQEAKGDEPRGVRAARGGLAEQRRAARADGRADGCANGEADKFADKFADECTDQESNEKADEKADSEKPSSSKEPDQGSSSEQAELKMETDEKRQKQISKNLSVHANPSSHGIHGRQRNNMGSTSCNILK